MSINAAESIPNIIAAINGDRPPHFTPNSVHDITELLNDYPPDPCQVNSDAIFAAPVGEVFPLFLRIVPAVSPEGLIAAADYWPEGGDYDVRIEWFSNSIPRVARLWDALKTYVITHPNVKAMMAKHRWQIPTATGQPEPLQLQDECGRYYGDPYVHFTSGAVLIWWRINCKGIKPQFLRA